ncbi:hypothetical protein OsccyDRAFT_3963 [Leptolyngbyaceae cyanobacterium JSC-12]|nr:hypothetical protein OsccyDRAFT_3963 [Leptolyngbyaceae cyanobacterium JSC-12]
MVWFTQFLAAPAIARTVPHDASQGGGSAAKLTRQVGHKFFTHGCWQIGEDLMAIALA